MMQHEFQANLAQKIRTNPTWRKKHEIHTKICEINLRVECV